MPLDEDLEDYESTLCDLKTNSKPNINTLTLLAQDYRKKDQSLAEGVVRLIETRLQKVIPTQKLPLMYLLDSIIKNVGEPYREMFTQNIVTTFCNTFERVDQSTRSRLYKLRTTWNTLFPAKMLSTIDSRIKAMDPSWPIDPVTAPVSQAPASTSSRPPAVSDSPSPNIHINPRVYPHFPLANQLGVSPVMYARTAAPVVSTSVASGSFGAPESRDPRLRGKPSNGPIGGSDIDKGVHATTMPIMSSRPMPPQDPFSFNSRQPQDQPMFSYYGIPPAMNPQAAPMIRASAPALVTAQTPDGGIVQLTPEQLKAAAAVAPIPGISATSKKSTTERSSEGSERSSDDAPSTSSAISGAKINKTDQTKKKFQKQQPKRPLSPWRTKRASPPSFMKDKDKRESPVGDRLSPPIDIDRRRAESEGKRKRSNSPVDVSWNKESKLSERKTFSPVRGRSSSPPKKLQNNREPPMPAKSDEPKYGSNVAPKKQKISREENVASGPPVDLDDRENHRKEVPPVNVHRNPVTSKTKIMTARNNRNRSGPQSKQAYGANPPKGNQKTSEVSKNKQEDKKSRTPEEGFIPIQNDSQVGRKDVDYRGIRGAGPTSGVNSIRVAGVRRAGAGVPEVITPEQVYARAEMLLKSGKLTPQQCKDLEDQIREVQRRREKDTEKKASTDFDLRQSPREKTVSARNPEQQNPRFPRSDTMVKPGFEKTAPWNGQNRPPPPPMRGEGRYRPENVRDSLLPPPPRQFPPPISGPMRGGGGYRGPPGPPGPPMRMGPPRMRPDQRWMNRGPPPRFPMDASRSQSGPMFVQRPNNMGRPQGPPRSTAARFPPPPSAVYQFGPGYGYSADWDKYYDENGTEWPKDMPFDPRFAGTPVNRPQGMAPTGMMSQRQPRPAMPMRPENPNQDTARDVAGPEVEPRAPHILEESNVDLSSLFNKLVDMGMLSSSCTLDENGDDSPTREDNAPDVIIEDDDEDESMRFKPSDTEIEPLADVQKVSFENESLKQYQLGVIQRMYRGLQCSSCGMRYPINKQSQYTAHLDWHFRQKRRKADGYVGSSREWYPVCEDWFNLVEQADKLSAGFGDESAARALMQTSANENVAATTEVTEEVMSVCADSRIANDEICKICREYFEQFWHVTAEEWHFSDAIRVEGKTVHFHCYKEFTGTADPVPSVPPTPGTPPPSNGGDAFKTQEPKLFTPIQPNAPDSATGSNCEQREDGSKPQHSLGSLNSILQNLSADSARGSETSEVIAKLGNVESIDDGDEIKIKEEPQDFSDSSAQKTSRRSEAQTNSAVKNRKPEIIKIKDEPLDESDLELQILEHRGR